MWSSDDFPVSRRTYNRSKDLKRNQLGERTQQCVRYGLPRAPVTLLLESRLAEEGDNCNLPAPTLSKPQITPESTSLVASVFSCVQGSRTKTSDRKLCLFPDLP